MRELVDADSASLPTATTAGDVPQQSEIIFRGNRAKLRHRRRGKRGTRSKERRNAPRSQASKQKCRRWRSRGVVGVPHPTRRKNEGKNLGKKHLELSERRRAFVYLTTVCVLFLFRFFGDVAFSEYFCTIAVSSWPWESTSYVLSFRMVFFYLL